MVALWTAHAQLSRFYLDSTVVVANQALHENTKVRGLGFKVTIYTDDNNDYAWMTHDITLL